MIHAPFSTPEDFTVLLKPKEQLPEEWYIFSNEKLLLDQEGDLPTTVLFPTLEVLYLGVYNQKHQYAASLQNAPPDHDWILKNLRHLFGVFDDAKLAIAGFALQLLNWDETTKFCGCCGHKTAMKELERCKECPSCKYLFYPKLSPVVMALVRRDDKLLLARGSHFPEKMYSVLAGYVDPGESLEACVAREIFEEVGIKVKNITYFGSQPWPLSRSLMIAFTCDWAEGEINKDPIEIEDADWFDLSALPNLPGPYSIARLLIDSCFQPS